MKQYTTIHDIQQLLEKMFNDFNSEFYNNELAPTMITIMKSRHGKELGWGTTNRVWYQKDTKESNSTNSFFEINICADALYLPIHDIAEIMLHEMAHIYNVQNQIKDTSRNGTYHNKHFASTAKSHGLLCDKSPNSKNGFGITKLNDHAISFVKNMQYAELNLVRHSQHTRNGGYLRYVCPVCGSIIRSTKDVHVLCLDCNVPFKYEESRQSSLSNEIEN